MGTADYGLTVATLLWPSVRVGTQKVQGFCGQVPTRGEISSGRRNVVEHQELPVARRVKS
jgi:hypothetical protein